MRNYARAGLALLTLITMAGTVHGQVRHPQDQAKLQDAVAEIKLRDRADRGDGAAMVELGRRAMRAKDEAEGLKWFQKAADVKNPDGQFAMGLAHIQGWGGTPVDEIKGLALCELAARAGLAPAMTMCGLTYDSPRTDAVQRSDEKAVYWYTQGAKFNDRFALRRLAQFTMSGSGGLKADPKAAAKLFARGAEAGDAPCLTALAWMHFDGIGGFVQSDKEALRLFRTAAEAGDASAISALAHAYLDGRMGLAKDAATSTSLFRKAAQAGNVPSMTMLGVAYHLGHGVSVNDNAAVKWFEKAIKAGDPEASFFLGAMLKTGKGVEKDEARAFKLFEGAAEQGNPMAMLALADCYRDGSGGQKSDPVKAFAYTKKAADAGFKLAHMSLAIAYANGQGVDRNARLAETSLQTMVKIKPDDPNSYGNYAWLLLGEGRIKDGLTQLDKAFSLTTEETRPGIQVEIWYYTLAFRPQSRDQAIEHLRTLINDKKARSENWNFSRVTARALKAFPKHQDAKWLPVLADVIAGKAEPSVLAEWPAWNQAAPQQATVTEKGAGTGE